MQSIKNVLQAKPAIIVYLSFISVILAFVLRLFGLKVPLRVGYIFVGLNFLISYFIGYWIKKENINLFWFLFWPLLFAVTVFVRYADYNYFFSLIYLLISALGYNYQSNYR